MRPGPSAAVQVLVEMISIDQPPKAAIELLADICLRQGWAPNEADAQELAEKWSDQFLNNVRQEINQSYELGRFSPYTLNSSSEYLIQGCAFIEPQDNGDVVSAKMRRSLYGSYWSTLGRIDPRRFEAMCAGIIQILGVDVPDLTKYSADEGIDFYGKIQLDKFLLSSQIYPSIHHQMSVWIVGQAKHYDRCQVSTNEIRDLVGAVQLAKGGAFGSVSEKYKDLTIRVCDPVFYLFITTGYLSANCWRLLRSSGVLGMDGEMVAAFLADQGIGVVGSEFAEDELLRWLDEYLD